jgi:hypothetical protein
METIVTKKTTTLFNYSYMYAIEEEGGGVKEIDGDEMQSHFNRNTRDTTRKD